MDQAATKQINNFELSRKNLLRTMINDYGWMVLYV